MRDKFSRKDFLRALVVATTVPSTAIAALGQASKSPELTLDDLKVAQKALGVTFTEAELKELLSDVKDWLSGYETVRSLPITELVDPPTVFIPKTTRKLDSKPGISVRTSPIGSVRRPASDDDLAFMSVRQLGALIKGGHVTSLELAENSISRLQRYGDKLLCLVTLLPDQAREQAKALDAEMRAGRHRGPLHGIPCGVKDLFALRGAPTTWGAAPYQTQTLPYEAAVVDRLRDAGAVIVAKLSMGALAQGDVWFKGKTKNPWNPKLGSSGSSAGSACATAAGLVPFAIGTETLGSICSPSNQCRVTGFRPTFGRISRYGAMELSYTMDKVGPICRQVEDCALVFSVLTGADLRDRSSVDRPFHYRPLRDLSGVRIGFAIGPKDDLKDLSRLEKDDYLKTLVKLGAKPEPVVIHPAASGILAILEVEAASAFDGFTRSDRIHELKDSNWPESFRASRFVPGVEYLQAQRARALLMDSFEREFGDFDVLVAPGIGAALLRITNLTGHPQVLIPQGADDKGASKSVSFVGRIYEDDRLLAIARCFQEAGDFHHRRPDLSKLG